VHRAPRACPAVTGGRASLEAATDRTETAEAAVPHREDVRAAPAAEADFKA
jgi:hypothetical protein